MKVISEPIGMRNVPRVVTYRELSTETPQKQEVKTQKSLDTHSPTYDWIHHQVGDALW